MSNVLNEEKRQRVLALGRLGWSVRRIEAETGVCRKTAGSYLKQAGIEPPAQQLEALPRKPPSRRTCQGPFPESRRFVVKPKECVTVTGLFTNPGAGGAARELWKKDGGVRKGFFAGARNDGRRGDELRLLPPTPTPDLDPDLDPACSANE